MSGRERQSELRKRLTGMGFRDYADGTVYVPRCRASIVNRADGRMRVVLDPPPAVNQDSRSVVIDFDLTDCKIVAPGELIPDDLGRERGPHCL